MNESWMNGSSTKMLHNVHVLGIPKQPHSLFDIFGKWRQQLCSVAGIRNKVKQVEFTQFVVLQELRELKSSEPVMKKKANSVSCQRQLFPLFSD